MPFHALHQHHLRRLTNFSISWKPLTKGIAYTQQKNIICTFKINLVYYRFNIITAKDLQQTSLFANQFIQSKNVAIAINGGVFTPDLHLLGLKINNGKILSPFKRTSWWGIFTIKDRNASIVSHQAYRYSPRIDFAYSSKGHD